MNEITLPDALTIISDIAERNKDKNWKNINYTDKYNMIVCSRIANKNFKEIMKELDVYASIPLERLEEEEIKEKNKYLYN